MGKKKISGNYRELLLMAFPLIITITPLMLSGLFDSVKPRETSGKILMWAGLVIMIFIAPGLHELGHLITGLLQGFKFQLFVIGPLGIKRKHDSVKIYLNRDLGYYGGVAATSPVDDDPLNTRKFGRIILAGPITSFISAVIFILIAGFIGRPFGIVFFIGGLISITIFYATTIPSRAGMFFSDRKRYRRLNTPGKEQDTEMALLNIMGLFYRDNSYRNVNKKDIEILAGDENPFLKFYGLYVSLYYRYEVEKRRDKETEKKYKLMSHKIKKGIAAAFDKNLEDIKQKYLLNEE